LAGAGGNNLSKKVYIYNIIYTYFVCNMDERVLFINNEAS